MLSDEEKEIFNNLKEYMQSKINKGYHKFIYNDLDWDFKCIDCINAINNALKQSKEIEELKGIKFENERTIELFIEGYKRIYKELDIKSLVMNENILINEIKENFTSKDKIKAKIEELEKQQKEEPDAYLCIKVLQSLLEKE